MARNSPISFACQTRRPGSTSRAVSQPPPWQKVSMQLPAQKSSKCTSSARKFAPLTSGLPGNPQTFCHRPPLNNYLFSGTWKSVALASGLADHPSRHVHFDGQDSVLATLILDLHRPDGCLTADTSLGVCRHTMPHGLSFQEQFLVRQQLGDRPHFHVAQHLAPFHHAKISDRGMPPGP